MLEVQSIGVHFENHRSCVFALLLQQIGSKRKAAVQIS
jgi:hypothetical protein